MTRPPHRDVIDRPHVSPWFLWAAEHHAALAQRIEDARPDGRKYPFIEHRVYVVSSVVASASFLEAVINEIFQDVEDRGAGSLRPADQLGVVTEPIPEDVQVGMRDYWTETERGRRAGTLKKYERLMQIATLESLDSKIVSDAALLVKVRNELVHYHPRDHYRAKQARTFENQLKSRGIAPNPLVGNAHRAYWTEHALGAGLASWGIQAVLGVTDATAAALEIVLSYTRHRTYAWFDAEPGTLELCDEGHPG